MGSSWSCTDDIRKQHASPTSFGAVSCVSLCKSSVTRCEPVSTCEHDAGAGAMARKSCLWSRAIPAAMAPLRVSAGPFFLVYWTFPLMGWRFHAICYHFAQSQKVPGVPRINCLCCCFQRTVSEHRVIDSAAGDAQCRGTSTAPRYSSSLGLKSLSQPLTSLRNSIACSPLTRSGPVLPVSQT